MKIVKNWPKSTSVRDVKVFIGFANFYQRFILGYSKIVILFTFLLKIIGLSDLASKAFKANNNKVVDDGDSRANKTIVNLSNQLKIV